MRIGLLSPPIGNGNLGDEATVAAVIQNIRRKRPGAVIYTLAANPEDAERRHGVPAFPATRWARRRRTTSSPPPHRTPAVRRHHAIPASPQRRNEGAVASAYGTLKAAGRMVRAGRDLTDHLRFVCSAARYLRGTDLLLLTGSGVLSDQFGGAANFPLTIFVWTLLARMAGARVAVLSSGAGPLDSRLSRILIRSALRLASYRSVRDDTSRRVVEALGMPGPTPVMPDLAHSLDLPSVERRSNTERPLVGINVFPHGDPRYWPVSDLDAYRRYIEVVAVFAAWLLQNKYRVYFFPTQLRADRPVIDDVTARLTAEYGTDLGRQVIDRPIRDLEDLLVTLAQTDVVVATRFHGILLSLLVHTPVLAIANQPKMADLMLAMNQAQYRLDIGTLTVESLIERFTLLQFNRDSVKAELTRRVAEYREALDRQYDAVLDLTAAGGRAARDQGIAQ